MPVKVFRASVEKVNSIDVRTNEFLSLPFNQKGFFSSQEKRLEMGVFRSLANEEREARHRLVKAPKSPTTPESEFNRAMVRDSFRVSALSAQHVSTAKINDKTGELIPFNPTCEVEPQKQATPLNQTGCMTVIQYREWADEWRVRTQADVTSGSMPAPQTGARISEMLSERAAKKIAESCEYMATKGGYKTFVTGTFDEETRQKIERGETTIQREVSRAMDALQKMYQRGWVTESGEKVAGNTDGLAYAWVVEIPKNEDGSDNPHVHMLLGWRVEFRYFREWAKRIENIWGNGYFHLEKIKDGLCAGAYMAKAAGYMTKANGDENQGIVRGNRYGISAVARAPDWVTISKTQLHIMGQLIADVYDHLTVTHGDKYRERALLNKQLADTPKTYKKTRHKIGQRLQAVREQIKAIPVRCNKYQVILKGYGAANAFFTWAKGEAKAVPDWLPEKPQEYSWIEGKAVTLRDSHWFKKMQSGFRWLKRKRRAWTDEVLSNFVEQQQEMAARIKNELADFWAEYENLDLCQ